MSEQQTASQNKNRLPILLAFSPLALAVVFAMFLVARSSSIKKAVARPLSEQERIELGATLDSIFPERTQTVYPLPYKFENPKFSTYAQAAILINAKTGEIIFEKNADKEIPPASMTKLFLIYSVLQKVRAGAVSLDDVIPIDERAIAANMPPRSSLMFLGLGQTVTLRELLQGTSVASGNDAAHQIAFSLYGSMENFISEINNIIKSLGLQKTHIVESSGYSELNITTPREMAAFCKIYLEEFPDALNEFHSIREFIYPQEKNLPPRQRGRSPQSFANGFPKEIWTPFKLENTNKLLGVLDGCDGIKTGHIDESGYNLALTTKRGEVRYISVTMLGPGDTLKDGDKMRCADGAALQNNAHDFFEELSLPKNTQFNVKVYGSKQKAVFLRPAYDKAFTVPKNAKTEFSCQLPDFLFGNVKQGAIYGKIAVLQDGKTLFEIPLVAERDCKAAGGFIQRCDALLLKIN